jgi:hypothetical protein
LRHRQKKACRCNFPNIVFPLSTFFPVSERRRAILGANRPLPATTLTCKRIYAQTQHIDALTVLPQTRRAFAATPIFPDLHLHTALQKRAIQKCLAANVAEQSMTTQSKS